MDTILAVKNPSKSFGQVKAVADVSFEVFEGEVLGVPGPNGAGKTSMFNLLTGVYKPDAGQIFFRDQDITYTPAVPPPARLGL